MSPTQPGAAKHRWLAAYVATEVTEFQPFLAEMIFPNHGMVDGILTMNNAETNKQIVRAAFAAWTAGATNFFDLLHENVIWTIAGSGTSSRTFHGRQAFFDGGYGPIATCFASAMKPEVLGLYADGDAVVIRWNGVAEMKDGQIYRNSYAWFFTMRDEKVIRATAFLDLPTYDAALDGETLPEWPIAES